MVNGLTAFLHLLCQMALLSCLSAKKKKETWFWRIAAECAIAYNVQQNMQSIRVTRGQPACFEQLLKAVSMHLVLSAEPACKLL